MNRIESVHAGEFLLSEGEGDISRDQGNIIAEDALPSGQVLGIKTDSKEYAPYNNAATDGSEVAVAVLFGPLPASTSPRRALLITRLAEIAKARLTGLDEPGKIDLAKQFLIVR